MTPNIIPFDELEEYGISQKRNYFTLLFLSWLKCLNNTSNSLYDIDLLNLAIYFMSF